jgi:arginase
MKKSDKTIAFIGAPTDIGAAHRGSSMGPEALRVAGFGDMLERLGRQVTDLGNLTGPLNPNMAPQNGYRHLNETVTWCTSLHKAVYEALTAESLPIIMGGDHSLAVGSISAIARFCAERDTPLSVLWLDAHADFNTPETSPSGNIHGMPVAILCGKGPTELTDLGHTLPVVDTEHFNQLGIRSVDHVEKQAVVESGLPVFDMRIIDERGMRSVMEEILNGVARRGAHLHVSFDVDFLDPVIAPGVGTTVTGGPTYREAQLCMEMIHDSGLMRSLDIMELNPAMDNRNQTAELVVELVASLFGEQILSRHEGSIQQETT